MLQKEGLMKTTLTKAILVTLLGLSSSGSFAGTAGGGGGGGIEIGGNILTLSQAGLKIEEPAEGQPYFLDYETSVEVDRILKMILPRKNGHKNYAAVNCCFCSYPIGV